MKKIIILLMSITLFIIGCASGIKTASFSKFTQSIVTLPFSHAICENGGKAIYFGTDTNQNNVLEDNEISSSKTVYACKGDKGDSAVIRVSSSHDGCYDITTGIDTNNDGSIDKDYKVTTICDGADGSSGSDGDDATAEGLPTGAVTFISTVAGTLKVDLGGNTPSYVNAGNPGFEFREFLCNTQVFTTANNAFLATTGKTLVISVNSSFGYFADFAFTGNQSVGPNQAVGALYLNGSSRPLNSYEDMYALDNSGNNDILADNFSVNTLTNGNDLTVKFCFLAGSSTTVAIYSASDDLFVDYASALVSFSGGN